MTRKFYEHIAQIFSELGYNPHGELDFDTMFDCAMNTLHHADLDGAKDTVKYLNFCTDQWKNIEKMFDEWPELCKNMPIGERTEIEQVSDEDTYGVYYVTNAINNNYGSIYVAYPKPLPDEEESMDDESEDENEEELGAVDSDIPSEDVQDDESEDIQYDEQEGTEELSSDWYMFASSQDKVSVYTDSKYYIKRSRLSRKKMQLYYDDEALCKIIERDDTTNIYLIGRTPYVLYDTGDYMLVYDIDYFNSLGPDEEPNDDFVLASIIYDIIDKNSTRSVARLEVYEDVDLELMLLYCAASILIFKRVEDQYMGSSSSYNSDLSARILAAGTAAAMTNATLRRIRTNNIHRIR